MELLSVPHVEKRMNTHRLQLGRTRLLARTTACLAIFSIATPAWNSFGQDTPVEIEIPAMSVAEATAMGVREAQTQWAESRATIYTYGLRRGYHEVDHATGLLYTAIAGCLVDDAIQARAKAHNEEIHRLIEMHGLPTYSRKPHIDLIQHPDQHFDAQQAVLFKGKDQSLLTITSDGCELTLLPARSTDYSEAKIHALSIRREAGHIESDLYELSAHDVPIYAQMGPAGSDLLLLHQVSHGLPTYLVIDLRTGYALNRVTVEPQE
jgi:hypothetical protein